MILQCRTTLVLVLFALIIAARAEQQQVAVLRLKHRQAGEIVPVLQPLLTDGGTLSAIRDQIIIRTDSGNLEQIRQVLNDIDRPLRRFRIYVSQTATGRMESSQTGFTIRHDEDDETSAQYRSHATRNTGSSDKLQFVQAVEGQPAFINVGQSLPMRNQGVIIGPNGAYVATNERYRNVTSGFEVTATANGPNVTLSITPHDDSTNAGTPDTVRVSRATTTLSGRLGQWLDIGGVAEDYRKSSARHVQTTRRYGTQTRGIAVMVEEIR